ncbi:uncharacterized protein EKO05_0010031 [Ascochyta rabiei]|uniref:uncharacterized protein n=1 Tax=Didymella rabiei TaxID=5454 RepID=UPI00220B634D|nr:uncharacterized protein EKO05_0010031 [Ascochyta rabiei]UPX19780.1 hypothetical protein EKO05_0010031 [Ascochyta rabiei]
MLMMVQTSPALNTYHPPSSSDKPLQKINTYPPTGRCPCSHVTYTLSSAPLTVHACHCTYCQRETGSSFALNAIYEPDRIAPTNGVTEAQLLHKAIPTASGPQGQTMVRCPECLSVVWSHYAAEGPLKIVRVGTIDGAVDAAGRYVANGGLEPHAYIFARDEKRHRWFGVPEGAFVYEGHGPKEECWPEESLERLSRFSSCVAAFGDAREK